MSEQTSPSIVWVLAWEGPEEMYFDSLWTNEHAALNRFEELKQMKQKNPKKYDFVLTKEKYELNKIIDELGEIYE